jgi:hypothetical protein
MKKHKTQCVVLENDGTVLPAIDRGMVQLVRLLNRPGLRTTQCCQGSKQVLYDAYVTLAGERAHEFAHRLLDDVLLHRSVFVGEFILDYGPGASIFALRWSSYRHRTFVTRVRRVLEQMYAA